MVVSAAGARLTAMPGATAAWHPAASMANAPSLATAERTGISMIRVIVRDGTTFECYAVVHGTSTRMLLRSQRDGRVNARRMSRREETRQRCHDRYDGCHDGVRHEVRGGKSVQ